jgi:hypothetical protein
MAAPAQKISVLAQFSGSICTPVPAKPLAGVARNGGCLAGEVLIDPGLGQGRQRRF